MEKKKKERLKVETKAMSLETLTEMGIDVSEFESLSDILNDKEALARIVDQYANHESNITIEELRNEARLKYDKVKNLLSQLREDKNLKSKKATLSIIDNLEISIIEFGNASKVMVEIVAVPIFSGTVGIDLHVFQECSLILTTVTMLRTFILSEDDWEERKEITIDLLNHIELILSIIDRNFEKSEKEFERKKREEKQKYSK